MIQLEGDERFPLDPAAVEAKLTDAGWLARCVPDADVTAATADRAAWSVHPTVALVSGKLHTELTVVDRMPGKRASFVVANKALGAGATVNAAVSFAPADGGGTAVHWAAEVAETTGLLRMVPRVVLRATMEKVLGEAWGLVRAKLT